jgi:hypothetical protein
MNVIGRVRGDSEREERERKGHLVVKRMEVHFIYTYEDSIMRPTKHCF